MNQNQYQPIDFSALKVGETYFMRCPNLGEVDVRVETIYEERQEADCEILRGLLKSRKTGKKWGAKDFFLATPENSKFYEIKE